jgi:3-oxoacyl-[acyl-carrier protein] reductase
MKTAIVTGASKGIGKAIAYQLEVDGYNVVYVSRAYKNVLQAKNNIPIKTKYKGMAYKMDVKNIVSVMDVFEKIFKRYKSIDLLVNNAGINSRRVLKKDANESWKNHFDNNLKGWYSELDTNLGGAYICSMVASKYMLDKGAGNIINISSIKGKEPTSSPGYGASKAGVIKLTRDLAANLAPKIRINCIAPGFIDTGMTSELPVYSKENYKSQIPLGRFGGVEEIAKVASFLASKNASYITGATIDVNGGYLMD